MCTQIKDAAVMSGRVFHEKFWTCKTQSPENVVLILLGVLAQAHSEHSFILSITK